MGNEINNQKDKKQWALYGVMQRFFKLTKFYLGYAFYVLITVNERTNYLQAEKRGYDCTHSHDDSYILYGSARKYYFDKTKAPTRNYVTYKQYKRMHYPNVAQRNWLRSVRELMNKLK
jgi:hypothetical protein